MIKQLYNFIRFTIRVALIISLGLAIIAVIFALCAFVGAEVVRTFTQILLIVMVVFGLWVGAQEFYKEKNDDS